MKIQEFLSKITGGTLRQEAFYKEIFEKLVNQNKVYVEDLEGWSKRTIRNWTSRLKDSEVITLKKDGFGGRYYYKWHPKLLGHLNEWWKSVKKNV